MKQLLKSFILGFVLVLISILPLHAQTVSNAPADVSATAANTTPANQAPDDVAKKITDLVHAGKYAEAQQLTTGLLSAYPDDQRLIKAKALLDKLLAPTGSANATPGNQPTNNAAPAQPAPAEQLSGMDKVDYNALIELARQAQQNADLEQQKASLKQFMDESSPFLQKHPTEMLIWQIRAASALSLDDEYAGYEAGERLLGAGAADSNDPNLQQLISKLKLKGWLDRQKMEEARRNTADSLVNSLGMSFARVPGTTTLFAAWDARVEDFQAFVNDTHYDASQGMNSGVAGHQGATLLASYVQAHYEQLGNSWQSPGWSQVPDSAVTGVSWEDAESFCRWLTDKERRIGKIRSDQSYRLPTDVEWSMASGLEAEPGDTPKSKNGKVKKNISPLGNDAPNMYGIFGLGGGFWQFCEDWYDGTRVNRVARGGSWFDPNRRASSRKPVGPKLRINDFSFRVVLATNTQNGQASRQLPAVADAHSSAPINNPAPVATASESASGTAILHVYRLHHLTAAMQKPYIYVDGRQITPIANAQAVRMLLASGKHTISVSKKFLEDREPINDLDMGAGKEYWIRVDIAAGAWAPYSKLHIVPIDQAQSESGRLEEMRIGDLSRN
jgi:Sulfatase-modifying factor enzyme 1